MVRPCKYCESTTHTSLQCFSRPRRPLKNKKLLHRVGPVTAKWIETRHEWIRLNATPTGTWQCTYCPRMLGIVEDLGQGIYLLTLDHKKSRSRHPELRYDLDNLTPSCFRCNTEKGSKDMEEFILWQEQAPAH